MFAIKQWFNSFGAGTALDQPTDTGDVPQTPVDAAGLRDLEARLSGYTDEIVAALGDVVTAGELTAALASAKGVVRDSGGGYGARPAGFASVEFVGPNDPGVLAVDGDTWVQT